MRRVDLRVSLPMIADTASVTFVVLCLLILIAAAGELRSPGLAASFLSMQVLVVLAVGAGLTSLSAPRISPTSRSARIGYAVTGILATAAVATLVWKYFAPFSDVHLFLTVLSALTVGAVFIFFRRPSAAA